MGRRKKKLKFKPEDGYPEDGKFHGNRSTARALRISDEIADKDYGSASRKLAPHLAGRSDFEKLLFGLELEAHLRRDLYPQTTMHLSERPETVSELKRALSHKYRLGLTG